MGPKVFIIIGILVMTRFEVSQCSNFQFGHVTISSKSFPETCVIQQQFRLGKFIVQCRPQVKKALHQTYSNRAPQIPHIIITIYYYTFQSILAAFHCARMVERASRSELTTSCVCVREDSSARSAKLVWF